jgi:hypothetical protein
MAPTKSTPRRDPKPAAPTRKLPNKKRPQNDDEYRPGAKKTKTKKKAVVEDSESEVDSDPGRAPGPSTSTPAPPPAPRMPSDAAVVNVLNRLDRVPVDSGRHIDRPWYYFDLEEPSAKFRALDVNAPHGRFVSPGDGPLLDMPGDEDALPVHIDGYA